MAGKVSPLDEGSLIERVWWNGVDRRSPECLHLTLGRLPGGRGWFLWRSDTGRWTALPDRDAALAVVLPVVKGWTPMIGDLEQITPGQQD